MWATGGGEGNRCVKQQAVTLWEILNSSSLVLYIERVCVLDYTEQSKKPSGVLSKSILVNGWPQGVTCSCSAATHCGQHFSSFCM